MTTIPGLAIGLRYISWFVKQIEENKLGGADVEARQAMIEEIMRPGYEPTPQMLEAVRRACGVFYPKVEVLATIRITVIKSIEQREPCIDLGLYEEIGNDIEMVTMCMLRLFGGQNRRLMAYSSELENFGCRLAGATNASAYLRAARSNKFGVLPVGEFYYSASGDRVMNEKGQTGITSDSMRNFDCDGARFLVVKR